MDHITKRVMRPNERLTQLEFMERCSKFLYYDDLPFATKMKLRLRYRTIKNMPLDVLAKFYNENTIEENL